MKKIWIYGLIIAAIVVIGGGYIVHHNRAVKADNGDKTSLVKKGTLTIGLEGTYAPFSYRQDGKLKGFEVDLAKKVAEKAGLKAKFVPTAWDGLIAGIGANKFDVVKIYQTDIPDSSQELLIQPKADPCLPPSPCLHISFL